MFDKMTPQIINMINDFMDHRWRMQNKDASAEEDEYGFPFEPANVISTEPLGFYESAMRLQTQATELYSYVYTLNRHSPLFIKASALLEKLVRQLGICCITIAALEQEGNKFEMLDDLTISWLRSITAFNVRKCYSAFMEQREIGVFRSHIMDLSIRWTALDKRLTATENKIEIIRNGKIRIAPFGDIHVSSEKFSEESSGKKVPGTASSLSEARPFSVDKSVFSENIENRGAPGSDTPAMTNEFINPAPVQAETAAHDPEPASDQTAVNFNNIAVPECPASPDTPITEDNISDDAAPVNSEGPDSVLIPDLSEWLIRRLIENNFRTQNEMDLPTDQTGSASPP